MLILRRYKQESSLCVDFEKMYTRVKKGTKLKKGYDKKGYINIPLTWICKSIFPYIKNP